MKWMRFRHRGVEAVGRLDGGQVHVHAGDLFAAPQPTGEQLAVEAIEWLTPCRPTKMIGL